MTTHAPTRLSRAAQRHPVGLFLVVALTLSFALMTWPMLAQYDVVPGRSGPARIGLDMEELASILLVVGLLASAVLVTALEGGRPAVDVLFARVRRWRVGLPWWAFAVVAIPATTMAIAAALGDTAHLPGPGTLAAEALAIAFALLAVNLWEETAWAGFVQTHLERRHGFFVAAALTSVPFALVHLPLRVITGEATTAGELLASYVVLQVFVLFVRTLFGTVLRGAANSILLVAVTHTSFNRSNNADGIVADVMQGPSRPVAALLATVVLTVLVVVVARRRLSRSYRRTLDAAETTRGGVTSGTEVPDREPAR